MNTTIYWTVQHIRRATHDLYFQARCWWLGQQVGFLEWQLRLDALMASVQSDPTPTSAGQGGSYAVHSM